MNIEHRKKQLSKYKDYFGAPLGNKNASGGGSDDEDSTVGKDPGKNMEWIDDDVNHGKIDKSIKQRKGRDGKIVKPGMLVNVGIGTGKAGVIRGFRGKDSGLAYIDYEGGQNGGTGGSGGWESIEDLKERPRF